MRIFHPSAVAALLLALAAPSPVQAQHVNQIVTFGDSTVDSGWYKNSTSGTAGFDARIATAIAQGSQVSFTTPGGLMPTQVLGTYLGLPSDPANQPGGANYATGGARGYLSNVNIPGNALFQGAVPVSAQIQNYLASVGGRANPDGLYVISTGGNDQNYAFNLLVSGSPLAGGATNRTQYFNNVADNLVTSVASLSAAGARYIIVPNVNYSQALGFGALGSQQSYDYLQRVWNGLAANGVNFIPADRNAIQVAILANPELFGFTDVTRPTSTSTFTGACARPAGVNGAWSLLCSPQNLTAPNAQNIYLYADNDHFTAAGQKIFGDYYYSLLVAPSQISFLGENAIKARTRATSSIQSQIEISQGQRGPAGINSWVVGDVSHLAMNNYPGFPDDPSTPLSLIAGLDYRMAPGIIVGAVVNTSTLKSSFSGNRGDFRQDEYGLGLYAGATAGQWWGNVIGAYGHLNYDVNRIVPLGIASFGNQGSTSGNVWSAALEGGYKFTLGNLTHGPVAGIGFQNATIGAFTESGGVTSLAFGGQSRNSAISTLGYKASLDFGMFKPFTHIAWHRELANTDRDVSATLTTIVAPTYSLPGVVLGKDWGSTSLGTIIKFSDTFSANAAATADFAQRDVQAYGGRIGMTVSY